MKFYISVMLCVVLVGVGCSIPDFEQGNIIKTIVNQGGGRCSYVLDVIGINPFFLAPCDCFNVGDTIVLVKKSKLQKDSL